MAILRKVEQARWGSSIIILRQPSRTKGAAEYNKRNETQFTSRSESLHTTSSPMTVNAASLKFQFFFLNSWVITLLNALRTFKQVNIKVIIKVGL